MGEKTSELRTTTMYHKCIECGLVMAPQAMVVHFERKSPDDHWVVVGFEHPNGCPDLVNLHPSLSVGREI